MTSENQEHGAVQMFLHAGSCDHPEPEDDGSDEWETWAEDHTSGRDGETLCLLTPLDTACPACTEIAGDVEDLPVGEFVKCRLPSGAA